MTEARDNGGDSPPAVTSALDTGPPEIQWEESILQNSALPIVICLTIGAMTAIFLVTGSLDLSDPRVGLVIAMNAILVATVILDARGRRGLPLAIGTRPDSIHFRYRDRVDSIDLKDVRSIKRGFVTMRGQGADFTMADGSERHVRGVHWYQVDRLEAAARLYQRRQEALRRTGAAKAGTKVAEEVGWQTIRLSNATRNTAVFLALVAAGAVAWGAWSALRWGTLPTGSILAAFFLGLLAWGMFRGARKVPHAFSITQGSLRLELPRGQEVIPVAEIRAIKPIQVSRNQGSLEIERTDGRKQQFLNIGRGKLEEIVGAVEQAREQVEGKREGP